jgi:hypothetical protein
MTTEHNKFPLLFPITVTLTNTMYYQKAVAGILISYLVVHARHMEVHTTYYTI